MYVVKWSNVNRKQGMHCSVEQRLFCVLQLACVLSCAQILSHLCPTPPASIPACQYSVRCLRGQFVQSN